MDPLELHSFEGTSLLGFLAAVGALKLLDEAMPGRNAQLSFSPQTARARLRCTDLSATAIEDALVGELLRTDRHGIWVFKDADGERHLHPSEMKPEELRRFATERRTRLELDAVSGSLTDAEGESDKGVASTGLRAVGGGQLKFFKQISDIFSNLTEGQCRNALHGAWKHVDKSGGMRWAPEEDRSYALMANDPSAGGAIGERAANAFAIFGLTFFPVLPQGETVAFADRKKVVTWPLWEPYCGALAVRSLLWSARAQGARLELEGRGVFRLIQAVRVTRGQYRNFGPAQAVW